MQSVFFYEPTQTPIKETIKPKKKPAYTCAGVCRLRIIRDVPTMPVIINRMMKRLVGFDFSTK